MYIVTDESNIGNGIVAHNCRCTVIDVVEGLPPQIRRAKDPVTGKTDIINFTTYDEWKA